MSAKPALLRIGLACDLASGIGVLIAVLSLCLGRRLAEAFGTAAAELTGMTAFFGAAVGLSILRRRLPTVLRPARAAALVLIVVAGLVSSAPWWVNALAAVRASANLTGYPAALLFMLPVALLSAGLAVVPVLLVRWQGDRGAVRTHGSLLIGATLGIVLALWLWPLWGGATMLTVAGGVSLLMALVLLAGGEPDKPATEPDEPATGPRSDPDATAWIAAAAVIAVVVIVRGWLRLLGAMVGAHLLTDGVVVGITLLGVALGTMCAGWVLRRRPQTPDALGPRLSLSAVAVAVSALVLGHLPATLVQHGTRPSTIVWVVVAGLGPAALLWGAGLSVVLRPTRATAIASRLIPISIGAGIGTLLPLPWSAADHMLIGAAVLALLAVGSQFVRARPHRHWWALLYGLPLVLLAMPAINTPLRATTWVEETVAARAPRPQGLHLADEQDIRIYTDWFGATPIAVHRGPRATAWLARQEAGNYRLADGWVRPAQHARAGTASGLLGVLLNPEASHALVAEDDPPVALDVIARSRVQHIVAVRTNGRVADGTPRDQTRRSADRIAWKRGTVLDHLMPASYDIVVAARGPLWRVDVAMQATREAWERGKASLRPDGVWVQPLIAIDAGNLPRVLASFRAVFPTLWLFRFEQEFVLVGFASAPALDVAHWERVFDRMRTSASPFQRPGDLWKHFAADGASLAKPLQDRDPIEATDPAAELASAQARWQDTKPANVDVLVGSFPPDFRALDGAGLTRWMDDALQGWIEEGHAPVARLWEAAWPYAARPETLLTRARIALALGDLKTAGTMARLLLTERPRDMEVLRVEVQALVQAAHAAAGMPILPELERMAQAHADDGRALAILAEGMNGMGEAARAEALYEAALKIEGPSAAPPGTQAALGQLLLSGRADPARDARAIQLLRSDPTTYKRVESLDLLARTLSLSGDKQADMTEKALASLAGAQGREQLLRAKRYLLQGAWRDAATAAREATNAWPGSLDAWSVRGFALEAVLADPSLSGAARQEAAQERLLVRAHIQGRAGEGDTAAATRAQRVLGWFEAPVETAVQPRR